MSRDRSSRELCVVVREISNPFATPGDDYRPILDTLQGLLDDPLRLLPTNRPGLLLSSSRVPLRLYFYDTDSSEAIVIADQVNQAILAGNPIGDTIVIAFPNRSAKGAAIDGDGGGPGSPAVDIPTAYIAASGVATADFGRLTFPKETLATAVTEGDGNADNNAGVVVAILDSWPNMPEADWQKNWLLQSLQGDLAALPTYPLGTVASDYPSMPSHGLFVAGLIHSIAPTVPIQVVQALNEQAAGDIGSILEGLEQLYASPLLKDNPFLILNLSLRFNDAPPNPPSSLTPDQATALLIRLLQFMHAVPNPSADESAAAVAAAAAFGSVALSGGQALYNNIIETLFWSITRSRRTLIIAAAGNDREGRTVPPPGETAPAYYGDGALLPVLPLLPTAAPVVGVAALSTFAPYAVAAYTNWGDIATLGGDVVETVAELVPKEPATSSDTAKEAGAFSKVEFRVENMKPDAVVGLKADSPSGWCYWAGSSFATAIVSGVAAALASADASLRNPIALRERLLGNVVSTGTLPPYTAANQAMSWLEVQQNR